MKLIIAFLLLTVSSIITFQLGAIYGRTNAPLQEYQIRLEIDSAYLYDGNRLVGSCGYEEGDGSGIDSLIFKDNL